MLAPSYSDLGFATSTLERRAEWRSTADEIAREWHDPRRQTILLTADNVLVDKSTRPWRLRHDVKSLPALEADTSEQLYLGRQGDIPVFAARPADIDAADDPLEQIDLRSLAMSGEAAPQDLGCIAAARALLAWHERHRYCANCGHKSDVADAGWRRECPNCGTPHFPRTDPVVIMLVTKDDKVLLGRSPNFRPGMYSCLAGFVEPGETIEAAVRREVMEECGVTVGRVDYQLSQPWPFPMSLMIGCAAEAMSDNIQLNDQELEHARWFSADEIAAMLAGSEEAFAMPPKMAIAHHLIANYHFKAADT